ncbi:MAG: hypothetical protein F6K19_08195 [Cyanothece sp. SIO1E1]|nr:hypothetical protein [Cyanothece sp. SIO1E1]
MATPAHQTTLNSLRQQLQQAWENIEPNAAPLSIQCVLKHGKLMILGQHQTQALAEPQPILAKLEQVIRSLSPEVIPITWNQASTSPPITLYLRVFGQKQPYAFHRFTLESAAVAHASGLTSDTDQIDPDNLNAPDATLQNPEHTVAPTDAQKPNYKDPADTAIVNTDTEDRIQSFPSLVHPEPIAAAKPFLNWLTTRRYLPGLALAVAIGVTVLASGTYVLTRPCVMGQCRRLTSAQQLRATAIEIIQQNPSSQDVVEAYRQLLEANRLLSPIPSWSKFYPEAQSLLPPYEQQAQELSQVVTAQNFAITAAEISYNPPHPVERWAEAKAFWGKAIDQLQQISQDSEIFSLARQKLETYSTNRATIEKRIQAEQEADAALSRATGTAQVATAREGVAASLSSWQLIASDWQTAVNQLQQIPQGTLAYSKAQELKSNYQTQLTAARNRQTQERLSMKAYGEATRLAEQARSYEQLNQWSQAVTYWRNALGHAQQVPKGTAHDSQAQSLTKTYQDALQQAEVTLKNTVTLQQAKSDLQQTCAGTPKICDYTATPKVIQVRINPNYDRTVERSLIEAELQGDQNAQVDIVQHVQTLLRALAVISNNARIPIELYDPNGALVSRYEPRFSGYVDP